MDWIQTLSIVATVIASAYYMHREVQSDIRAANARTDKLYEMYCEVRKDFSQQIIELIKEGRKG